MGDSEDEYERRRDKFRGERSEYPAGGQPGGRDRRMDSRRGGREDWPEGYVAISLMYSCVMIHVPNINIIGV